eukprot:SAG11_NODE_25153_length_363_cov_0.590909_2_plen_41_part_01
MLCYACEMYPQMHLGVARGVTYWRGTCTQLLAFTLRLWLYQ